MANDEAQRNVPPRDGDFDYGIRYDAPLGVWVYLLPHRERAEAARDVAYLREWFESFGSDAACGTIELPAKDRASVFTYTPGWYAYTLANPRVAREDAGIVEWELREEREDVSSYLVSEIAGLDWRHKPKDEARWAELEDMARQLNPCYDDSWVYEDFEDFEDSDDSDD